MLASCARSSDREPRPAWPDSDLTETVREHTCSPLDLETRIFYNFSHMLPRLAKIKIVLKTGQEGAEAGGSLEF